jgi:hypothetical protein
MFCTCKAGISAGPSIISSPEQAQLRSASPKASLYDIEVPSMLVSMSHLFLCVSNVVGIYEHAFSFHLFLFLRLCFISYG